MILSLARLRFFAKKLTSTRHFELTFSQFGEPITKHAKHEEEEEDMLSTIAAIIAKRHCT